jgi:hypothetical protein
VINISFDFTRLSEKLDEIESAIKDAVRPAAQAGAKVLYEAAMAKVPVAKAPHYDSSTKKLYPGGDLRRSLYRAFAEKQSKEAGVGYSKATYRVSWNSGPAKGKRNNQVTHGFAAHGHFMELGHWQPFRTRKDEKTGNWYTLVRPEMRGKPLPRSDATMEEKLKFFYPWPGGPRWVPPQPFLGVVYDKNIDYALRVANSVMIQKVKEAL